MPNRDGTGPNREGPKTGRQMGNCKGAKPIAGRGLGRGRGFGRGLGFKRMQAVPESDEKKYLEAELKEIEKEKEEIEKRLKK